MTGIELTTLMIIGPDCICKCKSSYHSIATIMPPAEIRYWLPSFYFLFLPEIGGLKTTPIPSYIVGL